jgi:hypothetical protein
LPCPPLRTCAHVEREDRLAVLAEAADRHRAGGVEPVVRQDIALVRAVFAREVAQRREKGVDPLTAGARAPGALDDPAIRPRRQHHRSGPGAAPELDAADPVGLEFALQEYGGRGARGLAPVAHLLRDADADQHHEHGDQCRQVAS